MLIIFFFVQFAERNLVSAIKNMNEAKNHDGIAPQAIADREASIYKDVKATRVIMPMKMNVTKDEDSCHEAIIVPDRLCQHDNSRHGHRNVENESQMMIGPIDRVHRPGLAENVVMIAVALHIRITVEMTMVAGQVDRNAMIATIVMIAMIAMIAITKDDEVAVAMAATKKLAATNADRTSVALLAVVMSHHVAEVIVAVAAAVIVEIVVTNRQHHAANKAIRSVVTIAVAVIAIVTFAEAAMTAAAMDDRTARLAGVNAAVHLDAHANSQRNSQIRTTTITNGVKSHSTKTMQTSHL